MFAPPSIPDEFVDDGCSNSPDSICGTDIRWACRIHDYRYCGRCHPAGTMGWAHRRKADRELRWNLAAGLPWWNQWIRFFYFGAVRTFGSVTSYNTCRRGEFCRHNMRTRYEQHKKRTRERA